jgi:hypothetical protein
MARAYGRTYSTESRPDTREPPNRRAPMLSAVAAAAGNRHSLRRTNAEPRSVDAGPQGAPDATVGTIPDALVDQTHEPRTR